MHPNHPFTTDRAEQIGKLGEVELLEQIRHWLGSVNPMAPMGMGDDCAVLPVEPAWASGPQLATVDALVWGQHFDHTATALQAGAKLVKRNLSDIAAMGGSPTCALLALSLCPSTALAWLESFFEGICQEAHKWDLKLVGGDITRASAQSFYAHWTQLGQAPQAPTLRARAHDGDHLYVTGQLGGSLLGHHLSFEPRLPEGQWLAENRVATAMIDLTDGLVKDLPQLLRPHQHAGLNTVALPLSQAAHELAQSSSKQAWEHALTDGEDYELCFSSSLAPETLLPKWESAFETKLTCIGHVQAGEHPKANPAGPFTEAQGRLYDAGTGDRLDARRGFQAF
jgi:thiamine-monophosphate kinase